MNKYKKEVKELLALADVELNGSRPRDIQVHDERAYKKVLAEANLGLGESYMNGWISSDSLDEFLYNLLKANLHERIEKSLTRILLYIKARITNKQKSNAYHIGEWHYDIGNDLYRAMLDKNMQYSCGYWKDADTLEQAQLNKMELICKKLQLKKGMKVLDIGCGWGYLAKYMAENYGVEVVGITVSNEQAKLAKEHCEGLPIEIRVQDYRKLDEQFDRIVSVGMIEHVGYKNYGTYMKVADRCLKGDGLFLLHTIGFDVSAVSTDPWIDKYIFPNGMLPSIKQLAKAIEGIFIIEDMHNFGKDYDKTLMAWHSNFKKAWPKLKDKYDERFYRMWEYYLLSCAAGFRAKHTQLWQIVLSKKEYGKKYESIR